VVHVGPFYLVIIDNQGPKTQLFSETDTLPSLMDGPSYKAHNPIYPGCCTLNPRVSPAVCAPINLSFLHVVQSLFSRSLQFCFSNKLDMGQNTSTHNIGRKLTLLSDSTWNLSSIHTILELLPGFFLAQL
jgi:hypothetical protein